MRKSIAQVLTVINQTRKMQLREFYKGKQFKPLDLRPKQTKALRIALTARQLNKKSDRQARLARAWPKRLYAVKA